MNHGSLFSGIGGFDLAAELMGWENKFHCEWNDFGREVLKYYWPNATSYEDIKKTDFRKWKGKIDIITGGFPCQPFSSAGKRKGIDDDRYLWPEMLRTIREIEPTYVVAENVFGIVNQNRGLVFEQVCIDLEVEGYQVQPVLLPASGKNAPHQRQRFWFVAYSATNRRRRERQEFKEENRQEGFHKKRQLEGGFKRFCICGNATNAMRNGLEGPRRASGQVCPEENQDRKASWNFSKDRWPTQSPICGRNDGLSSKLDGITFPKWRQESIKAYGNAIVPQVAYEIFKVIDKLEQINHENYNRN